MNTTVDENVKIKSILTARLSAIFLASASDSDCPQRNQNQNKKIALNNLIIIDHHEIPKMAKEGI